MKPTLLSVLFAPFVIAGCGQQSSPAPRFQLVAATIASYGQYSRTSYQVIIRVDAQTGRTWIFSPYYGDYGPPIEKWMPIEEDNLSRHEHEEITRLDHFLGWIASTKNETAYTNTDGYVEMILPEYKQQRVEKAWRDRRYLEQKAMQTNSIVATQITQPPIP